MGHTPSPYILRRLSANAQHAVDEFKSRSVWSDWWQLDEKVRRRDFTRPERDFVARWGAQRDELACQRTTPADDREQHFVRVCLGHEEPARVASGCGCSCHSSAATSVP